MSRIVQLANFVTPSSGGLRTALDHLASGYAAAGHDVVRIVPGPHDDVTQTPWGKQIALRARELPGTGYRVLHDPRRVLRVLAATEPDRVEVHDRTTLRGVGGWARTAGVPSLVVSHERLDRWLRQWLPPRLPLDRVADTTNAALAGCFDQVVCTTAWAEREFLRIAAPNLRRVPLGVELDRFTPVPARPDDGTVRLVLASRLSREKRADLAVGATRELERRRLPVSLRVAGDGPLRRRLQAEAAGAPVAFLGFVSDRAALARELGGADIALAPGPVETFGLAALEALACGTPVVANTHSALPEVLGDAGRASPRPPPHAAVLRRRGRGAAGDPRRAAPRRGAAPGRALPVGGDRRGVPAGARAARRTPPGAGRAVSLRVVALGDSTSCGEGVGLRLAPELTWPALLADGLPGSTLLPLASPGARLRDVLASQVQRAAAHAPHLVTLLIGLNDLSRGGFCPRSFAVDLHATLALLEPTGAVVLLGRLHDPTRLLPLPGGLRRSVQVRQEAVNDAVDAAAAAGQGRVLVLDLSTVEGLEQRGAWEVDRLHPNRLGHALLAAAAADVLRSHGMPVAAVARPATVGVPGRLHEAGWLVRSGLPWLARHVPQVVLPALATTVTGTLAAATS